MQELARATFGVGGVGAPVIQLMLMAVTGMACEYIARAAGKGQIAGLIRAATFFTGILLVITLAYRAVFAVAASLKL